MAQTSLGLWRLRPKEDPNSRHQDQGLSARQARAVVRRPGAGVRPGVTPLQEPVHSLLFRPGHLSALGDPRAVLAPEQCAQPSGSSWHSQGQALGPA